MSIPKYRHNLRPGAKAFDPNNGDVGTGILTGEQFTSAGTLTYSVNGLYGPVYTVTTSTTVATVARGFVTNNAVTVRIRNPSLTCSFSIADVDAANNVIFIGFSPFGFTFLSPFNNDDPLNGYNGIGIALNAANFKVASNDGISTTTFLDFDDPISAVADNPYTLTITGSEENESWYVKFGPYNDPLNIQTLFINTEIPDSLTQLGACAFINNKVAVTKSMKIYDWQGMF